MLIADALDVESRVDMQRAEKGIVFVHGFMGKPERFALFIEQVGPDVPMINLQLPGHGGSMVDFANATMAEWQKAVDDAVESMREQADRILLVGHSLGCLLLLTSARQKPDQVGRLFLVDAPFNLHLTAEAIETGCGSCLTGSMKTIHIK